MDKAGQKNGVNILLTTIAWPPDVALALNYVSAADRQRVTALMGFDRTLAATVAGARDAVLAQLKLAWWRMQLDAPVAGREGYDAIIAYGSGLLPLIDGWERLLGSPPLSDGDFLAYAKGRGGELFALLGGDAQSGAGWALADFARHCRDQATAGRARALAAPLLRVAVSGQPKAARILARLARNKTITRWTLLRAALG